jgi:hypothetical protein
MTNRNRLLEQATLRILNSQGKTVGAGFLIAEMQAVTCAHVVEDAQATKGGTLQVEFYADKRKVTAGIVPECWSRREADDVACLLLPEKHGKLLLPLASDTETLGHEFIALGFPARRRHLAHYADGKIAGEVPTAGETRPLLQVDGRKIYKGMSGSAVFDLDSGMIVGMISEYQPIENEKYAYATTSATIRSICRLSETDSEKLVDLTLFSASLEGIHKSLEIFDEIQLIQPAHLPRLREIYAQFPAVDSAVTRVLQAHPAYSHRFTIEAILARIHEKFTTLENVLVLAALDESDENDNDLPEIDIPLTELKSSIARLIDLIH